MQITEKINIFNIDCMEFMKDIPNKFYDLAIVDPPYGINATNMQMGSSPNRKDGKGYPGISTAVKLKNRIQNGAGKLKNRPFANNLLDWDYEPPKKEYFEQLFRISKHQIIWGGNYFTNHLPVSRCWICWDKMQPWENFSQFELAWTSFDKPAKLYKISNTGGRNDIERICATQKPVKLYSKTLNDFAEKDWIIFDSHGGSMSNGIASHDLGFKIDICELSEIQFNKSELRLRHHVKQLINPMWL